MAPQLPGYYYDEEKGKYFKIIPDCASATASKYSKTALARTEHHRHELKRRELQQRRQKEHHIQRSGILRLHPLGGMLSLDREHGTHEGHLRSAALEIWAKQLRKYDFVQWPGSSRSNNPRSIRHFIRDPATGAIAYSMDYSQDSCFPNSPCVCVPVEDPCETPNTVGRTWMDHATPLRFCPASEISSMSISPSRFVLATALGMQKPPTMHFIPLANPSAFRVNNGNFRQRRPRGQRDHAYPSHDLPNLDGDIAALFTFPKDVHTIWASAASPRIDSTMFAVGDSNGTCLVRLIGNGISDVGSQREWCGNEQAAETLTVDFWKPDLVLSGMRSGRVQIWDIRSKGMNVRFQHPSCISNVRAIDDNKVLVAGLAAKMAIYDTRFTKGHPQSHQGGDIESSVPLQVFPSYRSGSYVYPRLGFDIHLAMGLIASATEDELQIFNWKNGKQELDVEVKDDVLVDASKYKSTAGSSARDGLIGNILRPQFINSAASLTENAGNQREGPQKTLDGPVRCVKFLDDQQNADGLRLLVANGTKIDVWAW
ncbi:hypothetical protein XANCAGTX0491_005903 [Xanthoria calcicola]